MLVLIGLIGVFAAIGVHATNAADQSVGLAPADQHMIGDPVGDVTDGRGDVVDATFWSDIDALDVTVAEFEALETADWRYGSSRIVLHLDLDGDGAEEYEVMLRWMYAPGAGIARDQLEREVPLRRRPAHPRHQLLRQYSFIALPECLGYPTRIWWRGEMVHCDLTTERGDGRPVPGRRMAGSPRAAPACRRDRSGTGEPADGAADPGVWIATADNDVRTSRQHHDGRHQPDDHGNDAWGRRPSTPVDAVDAEAGTNAVDADPDPGAELPDLSGWIASPPLVPAPRRGG